ncbi:AMP-binding enzyme domain protein [Mycobacterium intracellulare 1956]|uniref:AMP-binding enzyme domain protein n=1 Tax=Mycobacterium intracellulare 1956 TaxID=1299331 RepID=X8CRY8_MYCIT|nr:AMP-binding enzyme domain protein [Mycobacterium intracellulare 1956]
MPGPADFGVDGFTVPAVLDRRAEQHPDRVMMSIAGVDVTFEQMRRRSRAAANILSGLGVGPRRLRGVVHRHLPGMGLLLVGRGAHRRGQRCHQCREQG